VGAYQQRVLNLHKRPKLRQIVSEREADAIEVDAGVLA